MSLSLLEDNWEQIKLKVIDKLWIYKFKNMYEACKLDKDDFDSLASIVLTKAFKENYDGKSSNIFTYATNVLVRKAKTELTYYHREKRNNGLAEASMQQMIDEENYIEIEDMIPAVEDEEINCLTQRYLDSLSIKQKKIARLIMQGYDIKTIKIKLGLTDEKFSVIFGRMKNDEKIEPLKKLKGVSL